MLRMRFLKIGEPDFGRRDVSCDRKNGQVTTMAVEQTVNQMQISGAAAARTHRQFSGDGGLAARREGGDLLMAHMHPGDAAEVGADCRSAH